MTAIEIGGRNVWNTAEGHGVMKKMPRDTPRRRDSPPCVESYTSYSTVDFDEIALPMSYSAGRDWAFALDVDGSRGGSQLQSVTPELPQVVLLEVARCAEEPSVCVAFFVPFVFAGAVFDAAYKVGELGQPIVFWMRLSIDEGLLTKSVLEGSMQNTGNQALPVVIVELNHVVFSKLIEIVEEEEEKVSTHLPLKLGSVLELLLPINKGYVRKRHVPDERRKALQQSRTTFDIHLRIGAVSMCERNEVKGHIHEAPLCKGLLVANNGLGNAVRLIVEHKREDVVVGIPTKVARFVNKNGELIHAWDLQKQESRGDPPALDGSPCVETHLSYTTSRSAESIVCEPEHKFVIIEANTCSTYGRAA